MINVVRRTGHSSYYVEKSMSALGKTARQMGMPDNFRVSGGAYPIWLENAPCCPIAVVACYSGSSPEDHNLVSGTVRDYISKAAKSNLPLPTNPVPLIPRDVGEWSEGNPSEQRRRSQSPTRHEEQEQDYEYDHHQHQHHDDY
jgi:hypothetical protein